MSQRFYAGVDVGGTTIKVGLCNEVGTLFHTAEGQTAPERGPEAVLNNIESCVRSIVADHQLPWDDLAGVGVGMPGFHDLPNGVVRSSPNFPGWSNIPLRDALMERLQVSVQVNNDANVAVLGESWAGAGRGKHHIVMYTLGTGIGGGIMIGGRLYEGFSGLAGELGHIQVVPDIEAIQCGCGQYGCVETVSSATGVIRMAYDAVERGDRTSLAMLETIAAKDVFDAAKAGDEAALRIVNRAAFYLGKAMAATTMVLNPEIIIVGGGMARGGDILIEAVKDAYRKFTPESARAGVDIVTAELGNHAGVVGAAGLHMRTM